MGRVLSRRVRLYQTLRTGHLEQALQLAPATIMYRSRRYDFDEGLAEQLDLVRAGPWKVARLLLAEPIDDFEINEPLMRYAIRGTALAVGAVRLKDALTRRRTRIVTYAIENLDPYGLPVSGHRAKLRRALDLTLSRFVYRSVDRIAFGTPVAESVYAQRFRAPRTDRSMILAISEACPQCSVQPAEPGHVLFLGAFSQRKGFPLVRDAWPLTRAAVPSAHITVIGQGGLEEVATDWASGDPSVRLLIDPERSVIHEALRRAQVLVLPSQPTPGWREQVGRPLVEALSHGVRVVTTTETGIAPWLADHGHTVITPTDDPEVLADGIIEQLRRSSDQRAEVLGSLPDRDGRLAADDWLFS